MTNADNTYTDRLLKRAEQTIAVIREHGDDCLGSALGHALLRAGIVSPNPHEPIPAVYLGSGIAVWLFARDGNHVGASGLVYGLVSYVFVAGLIRRDRRAIAASLLVAFMYGTAVWGVLPLREGVSWETHLAAALIGVSMAIAFRHADKPPRIQYSWEGETVDGLDESQNARGEYGPDGGRLPVVVPHIPNSRGSQSEIEGM